MKKTVVVTLAFALLMMPALLVAPAHAEVSVNDLKIPFEMDVYNPGVDEMVHLTGYLHMLIIDYELLYDNVYTYRIFHSNPQGLSGIGLTSGDKYQATGGWFANGVGTTIVNGEPGRALEMTTTYNSRLVGPGKGNNLLIHSVLHITLNANGELTATVMKSWIEVK